MLRRRAPLGPVRGAPDAGAVSIFVAVTVAGLMLVSAVVLDSCGRLRDMEYADAIAQEGARVAGQQLDESALLQGDYQVQERGTIAQDAANAYLMQKYGLSCQVSFKDAHTVEVSISKSYHTVLLGQDFPVSGHGTATLVHGVTKAENG
ncbi:hypothetical protein [Kitasatospora sp. MAP5-34]|uniref:hypothetical protein n=1 Tax=Kitasatospora sp. MAP5-34 TaxID=3035102 RepID=UPI002473FF35|nr:hypothetical protein [Kitasatospora sp. MAP5-34]MDH6575159.1 hypothetical protein [Kitasatospora sp. MAP5-34]